MSRGNKSATIGHYSTANGTVAGAADSQEEKWPLPARSGGIVRLAKLPWRYLRRTRWQCLQNTGNGWQKYDNGSWNSVNKPQPNWQGAENSQQRTGSESAQQRSSAASSDDQAGSGGGVDRSGGSGFDRSGGAGGFGDLDREAQNRSRGDFSSHGSRAFRAGALIASVAVEAD